MISRISFTTVGLALLTLIAFSARADVRLPALFSDNMVLQQGARVTVWGWADDGEEVQVTFRGKTSKTKAQNGKWLVKLSRFKAGGPDNLIVQGKNRIELKNVLVGEVWVCSGQSNMEWPLKAAYEGTNAIAAAANPQLRLFHVPKTRASEPATDVKAEWKAAGPESTPDFSAVAYYFGRDLQKSLNVPVGLIETCWGGTAAELWVSKRVLESNPEYKRDILEASLKAAASASTNKNPRPLPTELYNGMIAPLIPYSIKGAIWYQGESNAGRARQYRTLFPDMIKNWRQDWAQGDFTFLAVQLASYDKVKKRDIETITAKPEDSDWAELREAQLLATKVLP